MASYKIDISHVTKFDGSYFNIWKHRLTLIFKAKKLWPIVSGEQYLLVAPTTSQIVVGTPNFIAFLRSRKYKSMGGSGCVSINHHKQLP